VPTTFELEPSLVTLPPQSRPAPTTTDEARPDLQTVVQIIRRDCLDQPQRYLDEISVPLGGE
jgi:hypothetical protein